MTDRYEKRVEQICSSLLSEGHIRVGHVNDVTYFRHPNGRRLALIAVRPYIAIRENGHTLKEEKIEQISCHPGT